MLELDRVTRMMLAQWSEHRENEPKEAEDEYAVHVEYLRIRRDRWEQTDNAWRLLLGARLAWQAIELWETGDHK